MAVADAEAIFPIVYEELRRLATRYYRRAAGAVEPTSLVHEAFLKLEAHGGPWRDREHFMAVAATAMRQVLVDRARRMGASKRGGGWHRVTLRGVGTRGESETVVDLLALNEALDALAERSPRQARIVELRFFGGLSAPQAARHLGVSLRTVEQEWRRARAWLGARLRDGAA